MSDVVSLVVSVCVLVSSMVVQPTRASCPPGWEILGGVDRGGRFVCRPERIGCESCELYQPPGYVAGRVYCEPGFEPALTRYADGARCQRQPRT